MAPTPPVSREEEEEHRAICETLTEGIFDRFEANKQSLCDSAPAGNDRHAERAPSIAVEDNPPANEASEFDLKASGAALIAEQSGDSALVNGGHGVPEVVLETTAKTNVPKVSKADIPFDEGSTATKGKFPVREGATIKSKVPVNTATTNAVKRVIAEKMRLIDGNNYFQHYYAHGDIKCSKCKLVKQLLDHDNEKHPETIACSKCQLLNEIRRHHIKNCQLTVVDSYCSFCRAIKEQESVDGVQYCSERKSEDIISEVFEQIFEDGLLKEGTPFTEGVHFKFEEDLGEGGFGIVKGVKLLEPGQELLCPNGDINIELAAKIANIDDKERRVLKLLAHCQFIAPHYFIVNSNHEVLKRNYKTKKMELKRFEQILFMKRAAKSLEQYKNELTNRVLPLKEAAMYLRQIALAVADAHKIDIFHHDIKPSNVLMFCSDEQKMSANLCDFEFAEICGFPRGRAGGTQYYVPSKPKTSSSEDIYALGLLFLDITLARASLPPERSKWPEFKDELVKQLERKNSGIGALIKKCLEQTIEIDQLLDELEQIADVEGWWSKALM